MSTNLLKVLKPSWWSRRRRRKAFEATFGDIEGGTVVVTAPDINGTFEVDCRSDMLKRLLVDRCYETEIVDTVRNCIDPNRDAIDVGANIGLFTVLMSRLISPLNRVLAVEPTPGALAHLKRNIARNGRANVVVFEGVAAECTGEFPLNIIPGMEEYSSLGEMVHPSTLGKPHQQTTVAAETIDELVAKFGLRPGLIKIDAEGSEARVLAGCKRTMETHRPVVLCEVWSDELRTASGGGAAGELLRARGYAWRQFSEGEILALPVGPQHDGIAGRL
jgi:FkbM family methyltransferase